MPGGVEPCLAVPESCLPAGATGCCEPQEAKSGDKARKMIHLVAGKITNALLDKASPEPSFVSVPANPRYA